MFPDWVWTQEDAIPMENGFVNKWKAVISLNGNTVDCYGICLVFIRDNKIYKNEVYFDPRVLEKILIKD
jgi:hypothetical protein